MSKQTPIGSGFYGKLGQLVGQRWKDKFVLRTYVKTPNPSSEKQKISRDGFRTAVKLAQAAMRINGHDGLWDTSKLTEFQQRMSLARRRLLAGMSEEEALPLYPEGYTPDEELKITKIEYIDGKSWRIYAPFSKLDTDRDFIFEVEGQWDYTLGRQYLEIEAHVTKKDTSIVIDTGEDLTYSWPIWFRAWSEEDAAGNENTVELDMTRFFGPFPYSMVNVALIPINIKVTDETLSFKVNGWGEAMPKPEHWISEIAIHPYKDDDPFIFSTEQEIDTTGNVNELEYPEYFPDAFSCTYFIMGYNGTRDAPTDVIPIYQR